MFKLNTPKIRSQRQTFTTERQLILPLSQGIPDREQYAEIMQGYEVGDNYRMRKIEGYTRKNTNLGQVRIEPWGDEFVVFSKEVGDSIKIDRYDKNLTGVIETIGTFSSNPLDKGTKDCPKYDCDGFEFGNYFIFQVGGASYIYSRDTYFNSFEYQYDLGNTVLPGNYIRGVDSGAKAKVLYTKYYNESSIILDQWEGEFIEGEQIEHYRWESVEKQVVTANVPATYDDLGNELQAAYDEYDVEYVDEVVVIDTHTIDFTYKDESDYVVYIEIGAISSGDTVSSTSGNVEIGRISDNINHKYGSVNYGVFESDRDILDSASVITSHPINILGGSGSKWIEMSWAPQGYVIESLESGQVTRMLIGDIMSANGQEVTNGGSIVYYSEAYRENENIPFVRWKDDSFSRTGAGGWVAHPEDGTVKDIVIIKDGFIVLREKGIQEYSFNYYNQGNSSYQRLDTTYFRKTSPYAAISTPEGEFYVSEDGLFRMNLGNASGEYDLSLSDILGRRWEDYDFTNSVMTYRKGKLYMTFTYCDNIECGTNAVMIYDIRMKTFSYSLEWSFNDISYDRAVGDGGGHILFQNDVYGHDLGINNEDGLPTRFLSKEFTTDRRFYIDGYWIKWIGGDESDLTVDLKGRVDGCVEVIDSQELKAVHSSEPYFQNPTCSDSLGCEEYKYVKMGCHSPLTSVMFDIRSDDNDPHEIVEIGIRYTLHKKDYGC